MIYNYLSSDGAKLKAPDGYFKPQKGHELGREDPEKIYVFHTQLIPRIADNYIGDGADSSGEILMSVPIVTQPAAWTYRLLPLATCSDAAVAQVPTANLLHNSLLDHAADATLPRLNLTLLPPGNPVLRIEVHRDTDRSRENGHVHVLNPHVSRHRHAEVAYDPVRGILTILDVGSANGTHASCAHWPRSVDICAAGMAIFVGREEPATITLETAHQPFLEILVGGPPPSVAPHQSFRDHVIYGIAHDGSPQELEQVKSAISAAYRAGARSIALELSEVLLPGHLRYTIFTTLAEYAEGLGMRIIPLLDNNLRDRIYVVNWIKNLVTAGGNIDRQKLAAAIESIRQRILQMERFLKQLDKPDPRRPPEMEPDQRAAIEGQLDSLRQVELAQALLEKISYDMDKWSQEWQAAMDAVDLEMQRQIQSLRPDITIIGHAHARNASGIAGYLVKELRGKSATGATTFLSSQKDNTNYPYLAAAIAGFLDGRTADLLEIVGEIVGRHLLPIIPGHSRWHWIRRRQILKFLNKAARAEPRLLFIVLRAFSSEDRECFSCLRPGRDIEFLKLSVAEAKQRLEEILRG